MRGSPFHLLIILMYLCPPPPPSPLPRANIPLFNLLRAVLVVVVVVVVVVEGDVLSPFASLVWHRLVSRRMAARRSTRLRFMGTWRS